MIQRKQWSASAIMCYKRGGVCAGCFYKDFFEGKPYKCKMKAAVLSLVQNTGAPPNVESVSIYEDEDEDGEVL